MEIGNVYSWTSFRQKCGGVVSVIAVSEFYFPRSILLLLFFSLYVRQ